MATRAMWPAQYVVSIVGVGLVIGLAAGLYYGQLAAALGFLAGSFTTALVRA